MPERDLQTLLKNISAFLHDGEYVFVSFAADNNLPAEGNLLESAICTFREHEGLTLILPAVVARDAGIHFDNSWAWITCEVASDLNAVGFMAAIASILASESIPCNPVSAFHHDHLFVPHDRAKEAMRLLQTLST